MGPNKSVLIVLGRELRRRRVELGLSQEQLAERCRLHRNYVGSVERGERNIALINLIKLSEALEIRLATIIKVIEEGSADAK